MLVAILIPFILFLVFYISKNAYFSKEVSTGALVVGFVIIGLLILFKVILNAG